MFVQGKPRAETGHFKWNKARSHPRGKPEFTVSIRACFKAALQARERNAIQQPYCIGVQGGSRGEGVECIPLKVRVARRLCTQQVREPSAQEEEFPLWGLGVLICSVGWLSLDMAKMVGRLEDQGQFAPADSPSHPLPQPCTCM